MAKAYWTGYNGDATYDQDIAAQKDKLWQAGGMAWLQAHGVANPPTWSQILKADKGKGLTSFIPAEFWTNAGPSSTTYCGYDINGKLFPIDTASGKYEHYWDTCTGLSAKGAPTTTPQRGLEHFDFKGRKYAHVPNDWKDLQPISVYHPCFNGMEDYPKLTAERVAETADLSVDDPHNQH